MKDVKTLAAEGLAEYGGTATDEIGLETQFLMIYDETYGEWHGFDQMILMRITRGIVGEALGF